ncbi:hypothetical protein K3495_g7849 [Podosphaera aphanis]|nr:hypothetical protein K3495_g7849 [Podosphaera aphanis]
MVTNQKSDLIDYVDEPAEIEGADGTTISPGFGTVKLNVILTNSTTREIHLSKVRYIPQCPDKLFSLKKILSLGGSLHFDKIMFVDDHKTIELCEVGKSGFLIESRHCYTNAYFNALTTAVDEVSLDTWHRRLAHIGFRNVNLTKNITEGINISPNSNPNPNPNLSQCDACELGAPIERKHEVVKNKVTDALARIHVDTFHLLPKGYNGHKYGMILIDEATSERWGYTFITKNKAFECLKEFATYARNQWSNQQQIKAWRMDGGTEYSPHQFKEMCRHLGQRIEISTPYAPWQDGRAERSIRTVIERMRKTMISMEIPAFLWPEIFSSCIYLTNRIGTSTLKNKTPVEAFLDQIDPSYREYQSHKPDFSYLRVLGCRAYVLIPEEKRVRSKKLDPRAKLGILVGYEGENIYKIWVPSIEGNKPIRSSNVRFDKSTHSVSYNQSRGDRYVSGNEENSKSHRYFDDRRHNITSDQYNQQTDPSEQSEISTEVVSSESDCSEDEIQEIQSGDETVRSEEVIYQTQQDNNQSDQNSTADVSVDIDSTQEDINQDDSQDDEDEEHDSPNDIQDQKPLIPPKRYNTRGDKARPSSKQAENEATYGSQRPRTKYGAYPFLFAAQYMNGTNTSMDPLTYEEAMNRPEANHWRAAIHKEYSQLHNKRTWTLCKRSTVPSEFRPLTVRGFEQKEGIDYNLTFASTCSSTTWKKAIALAAKYGYEIHQMDVMAAFLRGDIDGQVYVEKPPMWEDILGLKNEGDICKLSKALYGLKQSPRLWQKKLKEVLHRLGYNPLPSDQAAYINSSIEDLSIIVTHVDDLLVITKSQKQFNQFKQGIAKHLDIEDLGYAYYFLGVRILRQGGSIYLRQDAYNDKILREFDMESCHHELTPLEEGAADWLVPHHKQADKDSIRFFQRLLGSIDYLSCQTRMDISFACGVLMRYLHNPSPAHIKGAKRIFRYLAGTKLYAIKFDRGENDYRHKLHGYSDANFDKSGYKSHSGWLFFLSRGIISSSSKLQTTVALSTTEAELYRLCMTARQAAWIRQLLEDLKYKEADGNTVNIYGDNKNSIALTLKPELHQRSKHIAVRWWYIRQQIENQEVLFNYCNTKEMAADGMTKPLARINHQNFIAMLRLESIEPIP